MSACSSFVACVLLAATASLSVAADSAHSCGDFLARLQKKPKTLEYTGCKHHEDGGQGEEWVAEYRVPGSHAAEVEAFFVKTFRMTRLKKSCCQWDGASGSYSQRKGQRFDIFEVAMTSPEDNDKTASTSRSIWPKIPFFYVEITLTTEAIPAGYKQPPSVH